MVRCVVDSSAEGAADTVAVGTLADAPKRETSCSFILRDEVTRKLNFFQTFQEPPR